MEPDIIAQNADGLTGKEAQSWFSEEARLAKAAGMKHARYTVRHDMHCGQSWLLFEAWREIPRRNGELFEGEPRWQIAADK